MSERKLTYEQACEIMQRYLQENPQDRLLKAACLFISTLPEYRDRQIPEIFHEARRVHDLLHQYGVCIEVKAHIV